MICVLPFCTSDASEMRSWLVWNRQLGGCKKHRALLVADAAVTWEDALSLIQSAEQQFESVWITSPPAPVVGWPQGPNAMFLAAAKFIAAMPDREAFFWCEPDCIPLRPGWLDALEAEYAACGKPFMGALVQLERPIPNLPPLHLSGCAVYPPDALNTVGGFCNGSQAWDMAMATMVVPKSAATKLVQLFWGQKDLAPTFSPVKHTGSPINTFTPGDLSKDAVVFHRNNDGTLIRLLRRTLFKPDRYDEREFVVVMPFHNGDAPMFIKNLEWQIEMVQGHDRRHDCLIAYDKSTIKQFVARMTELANQAYYRVDFYEYDKPPVRRWPDAANWAFQHVARFMQHVIKRPWLWMEYDMIPLVPDWLQSLQDLYNVCGMPMMGSVVAERGHCNGTAVYPANFAEIAPVTMAATNGAFDTTMASETMNQTFDASAIMQHIWGLQNGQPHSWIGPAPSFKTVEQVKKWINPGAVTVHRCKDGSLIDRLREIRGASTS